MQFQLEQDAIAEALRVITRLAPPVSGNITIQSDGKKLFMQSTSETSRCIVNLPAEVSGKAGTFAIALATFRDATKGRKVINGEYSKTLCKISSGAYKCELATVDAMDLEHDQEEKIGKPIKLTPEQAAWLKSAVATVSLKPTALLATFMPVSIKLTAKGAFVACYDTNHMAFINSSEITGDMEMKLPQDILSAVLDAFHKSAFKLETSKTSLYVSNQLVKVVLALPQEDENDLQLEEIIEGAKSTKAAKGSEIEVSKAAITAFLDNARAVATKERSEVKFSTDAGKIKMEVVTANGTTRGAMKASATKKMDMMIDFEFLDEAVRKAGESVVIKLVKDEFMAFKLKAGTIIVSLNQEA